MIAFSTLQDYLFSVDQNAQARLLAAEEQEKNEIGCRMYGRQSNFEDKGFD